jgi:hypothetical protein
MRVIGIAGRAGAGTHVVAAAIAAVLDENGYRVKLDSFGRDIKRAVRDDSGLVDKSRDRRTMQILGAEYRRGNPERLVNDLAARNNLAAVTIDTSWEPADILIIADVRDEKEFWFCKDRGIAVFVSGSFSPLEGIEAEHQSESLAKKGMPIEFDFIIERQKSVSMLASATSAFVRANFAAFVGKETDHAS